MLRHIYSCGLYSYDLYIYGRCHRPGDCRLACHRRAGLQQRPTSLIRGCHVARYVRCSARPRRDRPTARPEVERTGLLFFYYTGHRYIVMVDIVMAYIFMASHCERHTAPIGTKPPWYCTRRAARHADTPRTSHTPEPDAYAHRP